MKKLWLALALAGGMGCDAIELEADYEDPAETPTNEVYEDPAETPTDEFEQYEDVDRSLESAGDSLENLGVYPDADGEAVE